MKPKYNKNVISFRRRSVPREIDSMEDTRPLLTEEANGLADECVVAGVPEEIRSDQDVESDKRNLVSGWNTSHQEKKAFLSILTVGLAFMLVFTAFNTNGIITVSILEKD